MIPACVATGMAPPPSRPRAEKSQHRCSFTLWSPHTSHPAGLIFSLEYLWKLLLVLSLSTSCTWCFSQHTLKTAPRNHPHLAPALLMLSSVSVGLTIHCSEISRVSLPRPLWEVLSVYLTLDSFLHILGLAKRDPNRQLLTHSLHFTPFLPDLP